MPALPWIKVTVDLPHHPKLLELQEQLGTADGLGIVVRIWCWAAKYAPGGRIPARSVSAMLTEATRGVDCVTVSNQFCELGGPAEAAPTLEALILSGWLEEDGEHYVIHDWSEFQSAHQDHADQNRERQRRFRERNVTGNVSVTLRSNARGDKKRVEEKELVARDELAPGSAFQAFLQAEWPDISNPAEFEQRGRDAYPHVDLLSEARKARGWETANPSRAKKKHAAFFWGWLGRTAKDTVMPDAAEKCKSDQAAAKSIEATKQRNAALAAIKPVRPPNLSELMAKIGNGK